MTSDLATALGHVRNAIWQLLKDEHEDALVLGLEGLELEALLNQEDLEPDVVPLEADPAASLASARDVLEGVQQQVPPAAWAAIHALLVKLG
jgi:hypothetical protein